VPIGYTPNLTRIPHTIPDFDVFFTGWMTPRRTQLIEELRKQGLKVFASASCYGGARDQIISRSKVCLNIHHDGRDRFEIVRCSYLMANGKCVITEPSLDCDEYSDLESSMAIAPYRNMAHVVASDCVDSSNHERSLMGDKAMQAIQARDFTAAVASALDLTPAPPVVSRPMEFKMERGQRRKEFMDQARELKRKDTRVASRYYAACETGDMKDFAPWLKANAKGNIVEIGVRDGASTASFLAGLEDHGGHLWSIDVASCGHLFEGNPQWSFLQSDSKDMQKVCSFIPYEIDVLLIDGDHSKPGVINDLEYMRQLRPGGMVLFHDILPEPLPSGCTDCTWPSDAVKEVYEELCAKLEPIGWTHEEPPGRYGLGVLHKPVTA
jgi:predicted O-methyltransferase YrrM